MAVTLKPLSRFVTATGAEGVNNRKRFAELERKLRVMFGQVLTDLTALDGLEHAVEVITLTGTNITNKYVDLTYAPTNTDFLLLATRNGPSQAYDVDYTLLAPKRVSWNGLALDGILKAGHILQCTYVRSV